MPDVGGLFADGGELQSNDVSGVDWGSEETGDCMKCCIGDGAKSYGDGSANDMYIGLLAMVL